MSLTPTEISVAVKSNPSTGIYYAKPNQSIYDVCLQLYGTLDFLTELLRKNNFNELNNVDATGLTFIFDTNKVKNKKINDHNLMNNIYYATLFNHAPSTYYELRDDSGRELRDDTSFELL